MTFDWKSVVRTVAPTVATALGGPLAGMATSAISTAVLGKPDATQEELTAALAAATPDMLLKVKQAEQDFIARMEELGIQREQLAAGDRDSARQREIKTGDLWTPRALGSLIILGWFTMQWFLLTHVIPADMREIVLRGLGTLDLAVGLVLGYYFGSSSGSAAKTMIMDRMTQSGGD